MMKYKEKLENNLKLRKEFFKYFPEVKDWLTAFIPQEKFGKYINFDAGGFVLYSLDYYYAFSFSRPNKIHPMGYICNGFSGLIEFGSNDLRIGNYNREGFERVMHAFMDVEGISWGADLSKYLIPLKSLFLLNLPRYSHV